MGDLANVQAETRVNAEQASKRAMWEPTRLKYGEGRSPRDPRATRFLGSHRGIGGGMHGKRESPATREAPTVSAREENR